MKLSSLEIEPLSIPFRVSFEHANANRSTTESVLVTARSDSGFVGRGEGCPRGYVTGENIESVQKFFDLFRDAFLELTTVSELKNWIESNTDTIDKNPAAFCAIEGALLDLFANDQKTSVESLLSLPNISGTFSYTAVLGSSNPETVSSLLGKYQKMGFSDFKVKLFGSEEIDSDNLSLLNKQWKDKFRLRLDANNLWMDAYQAIRYIKQLGCNAFAIEEPLQARNYTGFTTIAHELDMKVILDESFLGINDFNQIHTNPEHWIINVRVSKMGGILRSLAVARQAEEAGIPIIIGAQVGETSLLTRAALTIANSSRKNLVAQEGAFGTFLLEKDIVEPSIMFGMSGILDSADFSL